MQNIHRYNSPFEPVNHPSPPPDQLRRHGKAQEAYLPIIQLFWRKANNRFPRTLASTIKMMKFCERPWIASSKEPPGLLYKNLGLRLIYSPPLLKVFFAILFQANRHEYIAEQQGLYTYLYRWIIITENYSPVDIQQFIGNITHVTVLTPDKEPTYYNMKCIVVG